MKKKEYETPAAELLELNWEDNLCLTVSGGNESFELVPFDGDWFDE